MSCSPRPIALFLLLALCLSAPLYAQLSVTTYHNDNARTGANIDETLLTPANVNSNNFGKLFASPTLDGWVAAQPLYVPNVQVNGTAHNVVYVATINNSVYAFDADTGTQLWTANFGTPTPFKSLCTDSGFQNSPSGGAGIVGTPVIDQTSGIIYFVAKTGTGTQTSAYELWLHAVDITTGIDENYSPVKIVPPVGPTFYPDYQMSRPGLLLSNNTLYVALGSTGCKGLKNFPKNNNHGYILSYNTALGLAPINTPFITTPDVSDGDNGGVWQSGGGLAQDPNGYIYFETADGAFDYNMGGMDFGDSVLKLDANLNLIDYFTPSNQGTLLNPKDLDLGSVGPVVLPSQNGQDLLIASGKTEEIFVLDRNNLGKFNSTGNKIVEDIQRPSFLSGCQKPPTGPLTCRYGAISYWSGYLYFPGWSAPVLQYQISGSGQVSPTPTAQSSSGYQNVGPISVSANLNASGIAWVITGATSTATLRAFDAVTLSVLYNSDMASGGRDTLGPIAHFATPTVINGKVYAGTQAQLVAYGLLNQLNPTGGNLQSAQVNTPIQLTAQAVSPYTGQPISGVPVTFSAKSGSFNPVTVNTDSNGNATTTYTLPTSTGVITVNASTSNSGFSTATFTETALPGPPASLIVISGNQQSGVVATTLPLPLVSKVKDAYNNNVPGASVTYADGSLGGVFQPNPVTSDSTGLATVNYTLPHVAKTGFAVTASSGTATQATFRETSLAGQPAAIATNGGNNQTGTRGTQLPKALVAKVTDQYSNPVPNVIVTFTDNGANGTFNPPNPTTNSAGNASTMYTLPSNPGTFTITASVNGQSVNFTETGK